MKRIQAAQMFSSGIAVAPLFVYAPADLTPNRQHVDNTAKEHARIDAAVAEALADLTPLAEENEIFAAHAELVQDPELLDAISAAIDDNQADAEWALSDSIEAFCEVFKRMDDAYMRERGADIRDVGDRLMRALKGERGTALSDIHKSVIVVAKDLLPSDTAQMDFQLVAGFITQEGGPTSHVAIIAKNRGVPALVGVAGILEQVHNDMPAAMDAASGEIVLEPDAQTLEQFVRQKAELLEKRTKLLEIAALPSRSADGRDVLLCANVGNVGDIRMALEHHPDGVGLFRTEFLFMDSEQLPTEEQQFAVYREAAEQMGGRELIVRTLDIGGDKPLPYLDLAHEDNPFLGYRAIRICLNRKELFATQLRALLRASAFGNLKIMYPMIVNIDELESANALLAACKEELRQAHVAFNERIPVGMMIETPASVVMADQFAKRVDFFSIGTNDLTQYILAADRGNKQIAYLYDTFDPAVLRCIRHVIDTGHRAGIPVGMCGEFASNPDAFCMLLGMGLDEFSMSAASIPQTKALLRASSYADAQKIAEKLADCATKDEVKRQLAKRGQSSR